MEYYMKVEYPCGLKNEIKYSTGFFEFGSFKANDEIKVCPLHGKNCSGKFKK